MESRNSRSKYKKGQLHTEIKEKEGDGAQQRSKERTKRRESRGRQVRMEGGGNKSQAEMSDELHFSCLRHTVGLAGVGRVISIR